MMNTKIAMSKQKIAKFSGFMYLFIMVSSLLSMFFIDIKYEGKTTAETIENILSNEVYFRISNAYTVIMYISVIILAVYLYTLLKEVNKSLAILALAFRLGEALIGGIQIFCNVVVLLLLKGETELQIFAGVFLESYWLMMQIVFVFLGLGSMIYFYLFFKSEYIPKGISIWGMCSFALVTIGAFISIIFSNEAYMILGGQAIIFEIFIGAWLLLKGINLNKVV